MYLTIYIILHNFNLFFFVFCFQHKGLFVTRIRDDRIKKELMGLLEFGDQIISVDGADVTDYSVMQVTQLMDKDKIVLRIIPYMNRVY